MTVITKSLNEKKANNLQEPLVENIVTEHDEKKSDVEAGGIPLSTATKYIIGQRTRPYYTLIFLLMLILLGATCLLGIFGTEYLYQRYRCLIGEEKPDVYRAWGTITYGDEGTAMEYHIKEDDVEQNNKKAEISKLLSSFGLLNERSDMKNAKEPKSKIKAEYELDLSKNRYEKISLPSEDELTIPNDQRNRFIHDFFYNKTAIVDKVGKRCFIMPLDRTKVLPPVSLHDLMFKMYNGYYNVDTEKIREEMHVVLPPLENLIGVGSYIANECKLYITYNVEKIRNIGVVKRSAPQNGQYKMFAGNGIVEYLISFP